MITAAAQMKEKYRRPGPGFRHLPYMAICTFLLLLGSGWGQAETIPLLELGEDEIAAGQLPEHWQQLTFSKIDRHTRYTPELTDGRPAIRASSQQSASGLIRQFEYSLEEYPVLQWRWKISSVYPAGDVRSKAGDDYPARIYITFAASEEALSWWEELKFQAYELFYGSRPPLAAINYIWGNKAEVGTLVDNPYTDRVKMIVVESGNTHAGEWRTESRNLREDYRRAFGQEPPPVSAVAIMTDTDNTGDQTVSWYGPITALRVTEE